ncbi:hypothetical protein V6N11_033168 [Hibiscus sabdariffa]|uniref:Uncharacterized protein n=1 Tax=Hibiscus sabdariffa TaxID=183260 RepID=A0ABR1ZG67_9ROSI
MVDPSGGFDSRNGGSDSRNGSFIDHSAVDPFNDVSLPHASYTDVPFQSSSTLLEVTNEFHADEGSPTDVQTEEVSTDATGITYAIHVEAPVPTKSLAPLKTMLPVQSVPNDILPRDASETFEGFQPALLSSNVVSKLLLDLVTMLMILL